MAPRRTEKDEKHVPSNSNATPLSNEQQFQKEVSWCIEQLRMGMFNKSPTEKQVKECERVIKILTSTKAPLVKKRQAMNQMFGDYRKKIEAEEKKWEKDTLKQIELLKISSAAPRKTGYVRTSTYSGKAYVPPETNSSIPVHAATERSLSSIHSAANQNVTLQDFKFNFPVNVSDN